MGNIKQAAENFKLMGNYIVTQLESATRKCVRGLNRRILSRLVVLALVFTPFAAFADLNGTSTGLEWEGPLEAITNSLKGPVAFAVSLLGMIATGVALIFGGEINDFIRRLIMLVLVISLIAFAGSILSTLFSGSEIIQSNALVWSQ